MAISKPVILTAANFKYFLPLKNSLKLLQKHFPDLEIIIYDLGLADVMVKEVSHLFTNFYFVK